VTIWICQCLCERRHCMIAGAFDDAKQSVANAEAETRVAFQQMVTSGATRACCRICDSVKFHYESGRTPYATMEEAIPFLAKAQADNIASGDFIEALRKCAH
jgi:hypothetical protein